MDVLPHDSPPTDEGHYIHDWQTVRRDFLHKGRLVSAINFLDMAADKQQLHKDNNEKRNV